MKTKTVVIEVELAVTTNVPMSRGVKKEISQNMIYVLNEIGKKGAFDISVDGKDVSVDARKIRFR